MHQTAAGELATTMRDHCLGARIGRLHRVVARHYDQAMRPLAMSLPQLEILGVLTVRGPTRPSAIAGSVAVERSTISRNLTLLEEKGWIDADRSPTGRTKTVSITPAGTKTLGTAAAAWTDVQNRLTELLGTDALETLDLWLNGVASLENVDGDPPRAAANSPQIGGTRA